VIERLWLWLAGYLPAAAAQSRLVATISLACAPARWERGRQKSSFGPVPSAWADFGAHAALPR
jgi:hypothetical protein